MVVVVVVMPKSSIGKSRCPIWASCGSEGTWGHYIALISICNEVQHGAGGSREFLAMWLLPGGSEFNPWGCNFFFNSKDPISLLYWCETQFCSLSLSAYINFSDSALSTLISAEHSDQHWTDLSGPSLSPFSANLAGERGKLTLISTYQNSTLADQR